MKGLKKLGSMALAAALTVTMAVPLTANAEVIRTYERDAEGNITNITYTNEDTKKSYSEKDYNFYGNNEYHTAQTLVSAIKTVTISVDSYNEAFMVMTTKDVSKYENFKSNKKDLKVKVMQKLEYIDPKKESYAYDFEDKNLNGNKYYKNVNGDIVAVPYANWNKDLPKGEDMGAYTVRLYAKKAGKYKITYNAKLKNGTTVKKTIKVIAKDNGQPIKEITFAGKMLTESKYFDYEKEKLEPVPFGEEYSLQNNRLWAKGFGPNYTTAKSGKIQVTMNKDFKLKKIEVGTPGLIKNKDGMLVYKDEPNSIDFYYNWKKVKNGKKIKLSKVDDAMVDGYTSDIVIRDYKSFSTETVIRVTYYDKKNKTTNRLMYRINRVNK